jgi:NADH dehydrogenase
VLLTRDELEGLMAGLVTTDGPATGRIVFSDWLAEHASEVGRSYASEIRRHFDR